MGGPAASIRRLEFCLPTETQEITPESFKEFMTIAEREYIRNGLEIMSGRVLEFGSKIGIAKGTIYKKMTQLGIPRRTYSQSTEDSADELNQSSLTESPPGAQELRN